MKQFAGVQEFYAFIDAFAERLTNQGLEDHARKLHFLMHKVAWTTWSELLGEIAAELQRIEDLHGSVLPPDISDALSASLAYSRKYS